MAVDIVYTPTKTAVTQQEDAVMYYSARNVCEKLKILNDVRHVGNGGFDALGRDGGVVYVVGHGNAGGKIGTHADALGAKSLMKAMLADGLPKNPGGTVTIHLYACASGTSVRTGYLLWRKDPYAMRFAKYLAEAGFNDFMIVGYVGFMNLSGKHSLNYHMQKSKETVWSGSALARGDDAPTITFRVNAGACARVQGEEWKQYSEVRVHRGRANSLVATIRK
ncbi:MAG: hypothetical protein V4724_04410 [Pseudomonadota bacterium]